jgi:hypothetical protein
VGELPLVLRTQPSNQAPIAGSHKEEIGVKQNVTPTYDQPTSDSDFSDILIFENRKRQCHSFVDLCGYTKGARASNRRSSSSIRDKQTRSTEESQSGRYLSKPEDLRLSVDKPIFLDPVASQTYWF